VDIAEALDFIRSHHRAVLATFRVDGMPQLSPVTVDAHPDGKLEVSTRQAARKTLNLRRDPRASLCVMDDAFYGRWISVEGRAEIVSLPEAMDGLVAYYRRVAGEHPDWDDYRAAMAREGRVLLRITVERAGPDHSG